MTDDQLIWKLAALNFADQVISEKIDDLEKQAKRLKNSPLSDRCKKKAMTAQSHLHVIRHKIRKDYQDARSTRQDQPADRGEP